MKKYMSDYEKLDRLALEKKGSELQVEIINTRRGVIGGEVQNTQIVKAKRRSLARINTLLNMLSNSSMSKVSDNAGIDKKSSKTGRTK